MRIYTSYYAKVGRMNTDALLVRVSNTAPSWFSKMLTTLNTNVYPDWRIINAFKDGSMSYETFCTKYRESLMDRTTSNELLEEIKRMAFSYGKEDVVLLCYEKNGAECHRTELAHFIDNGCYCGEL